MPATDQASARWRALLWLTPAVLVVHLWLLTGGWVAWPDSPAPAQVQPEAATPLPSADAPSGSVIDNRPNATPVQISSVRWIVPSSQRLPETTRPATGPSMGPNGSAADQRRSPPSESTQSPSVASHADPGDPGPSQLAERPTEAAAETPLLESSHAQPPPDNATGDVPPSPATEPAPAPDAMVVAAASAASPVVPRPAQPTSSLPPAQPPGPVELRYEIDGRAKGLSYSADAQLRWQPSGNRYSAELEISAFLVGSRVQTSRGRLDAQGLSPERFGDKRRGNEKAAHFDQAGQRIRYSNNAPDTPLLPGAQDRLSVFVQLAALFQARPRAYAAGQTIRLQVAGTGDADTWAFQVGPEESLALPAGTLQARRLTRGPRNEHDSTVDIWLAPDLQHLPVRIRITEPNGDLADQRLRLRPP